MQTKVGKLEFVFMKGLNEGTRFIAIGILRGQGSGEPYKTWNVEVIEVAQGIGMATLLILGTQRKANTLCVVSVAPYL